VAAGTSRAGRWVTRIVLIGLLAAVVVAAVAGITYATGMWGPLSDDLQEQTKRAIVGYELAKDPIRLRGTAGRKLTEGEKAALQARFLRRLARYATGTALRAGRDYDFVAGLRDSERRGRQILGVSGAIAFWESPRKSIDGGLHVRAGVGRRYEVVLWDRETGDAVPQSDWVPTVAVNDYTLRQVDGVWKVADSTWWRFYDPATGQFGTGP
jgi:hypothetical protein